MDSPLTSTLAELTDIQREAVMWDDGSLLVLAGPGSGKTRVLTCRIARLLDSSRDQRFRILALTFTTKAAAEMANRVTALVPGIEGRAYVDTFHGFCAQILRQHGVHLGIKPDFAIYSQTEDRQAVLEDALRRGRASEASREDSRLLPLIEQLKSRLVEPEEAEERLVARGGVTSEEARRGARAYRLYEDELRRAGALDFSSLIFEAYRLFSYPAMARHYQTSYRYWLVDEFQDTNGAQYALLRRMAGDTFREVFAVADDDQTIFEWNGANVRRIGALVREFSCKVVQLPTNFRCPPRIVEAANRLVVYNSRRVSSKKPAEPARGNTLPSDGEQIRYREFDTDSDEIAEIAKEIAEMDMAERSETAVLARNRFLLDAMHEALEDCEVPSETVMRRDDFASPQMRWLVACLKQVHRPLDLRNMAVLVEAFDRFAYSPLDWDELVSRSESDGTTLLSIWMDAVCGVRQTRQVSDAVESVIRFASGQIKLTTAIARILETLDVEDADHELKGDLSAWRRIEREIRGVQGLASLDQLLQELQLRSKEPVPSPGTVSLATIHGAKGREFDTVYLIGLAEEVLPSWHSVKKGDGSAALEEERRGCFVAVTRTRKRLVLSWARHYRGWRKQPSRFLREMGCLDEDILPDDSRRAARRS